MVELSQWIRTSYYSFIYSFGTSDFIPILCVLFHKHLIFGPSLLFVLCGCIVWTICIVNVSRIYWMFVSPLEGTTVVIFYPACTPCLTTSRGLWSWNTYYFVCLFVCIFTSGSSPLPHKYLGTCVIYIRLLYCHEISKSSKHSSWYIDARSPLFIYRFPLIHVIHVYISIKYGIVTKKDNEWKCPWNNKDFDEKIKTKNKNQVNTNLPMQMGPHILWHKLFRVEYTSIIKMIMINSQNAYIKVLFSFNFVVNTISIGAK